MSTAMTVVAAMAGSAPTSANRGPNAPSMNCTRKGMDAKMPATEKKMGPMEQMPSTNCFPSSLSGFTMDATPPATMQAMMR